MEIFLNLWYNECVFVYLGTYFLSFVPLLERILFDYVKLYRKSRKS